MGQRTCLPPGRRNRGRCRYPRGPQTWPERRGDSRPCSSCAVRGHRDGAGHLLLTPSTPIGQTSRAIVSGAPRPAPTATGIVLPALRAISPTRESRALQDLRTKRIVQRMMCVITRKRAPAGPR